MKKGGVRKTGRVCKKHMKTGRNVAPQRSPPHVHVCVIFCVARVSVSLAGVWIVLHAESCDVTHDACGATHASAYQPICSHAWLCDISFAIALCVFIAATVNA